MSALLVVVLFGIFFSLVATQNTLGVPVRFFNYYFTNVPLYLVVLFSLLAGVFMSWGLSLLDWLSTAFTVRGKDMRIRSTQQEIGRLENSIHELKEENAALRGEKEEVREETHEKIEDIRREEHRPHSSFLDRFRHSLSI